ncbi:type II secretion system protein GspL [Aliidiomarina soli]|uniref:Type II secretion system protein L n=2 Tax=Aliidiomarina soli TaxID=1928574 RepID=A0A432WCA8_9GAMM|nr:type II secretion system protein GspL [Aliidiomarina soli]
MTGMTKQLIIRLPGQADGSIPWLWWQDAADGKTAQTLEQGVLDHSGQLHELAGQAADAQLTVLVSSTEVGFHQLELPPGSRRHLAQVVPYALEEELAQDISELHFAWQLPTDKQEHLPVVVVAKAQVATWRDWLDNAGLTYKALIPDLFILPVVADEWSAMELDHDIVVRHQTWRGFAIEQTLFAELSGLFSDALPPPQRIRCWGQVEWPQAPAQLVQAETADESAQEPALALARHLDQRNSKAINLLQGEFALKRKRRTSLGIWRWPAVAAGVLLALLLVDRSSYLWQLNQQQQQLAAATEQRYRDTFPEESRVVNVRAQLGQHLSRLQGGGQGSQLLALLQQLTPAFTATELDISLLQFDSGRSELRIQASAEDFMTFERFIQLAREQELEVEQGQLNSRGGRIAGTMVVRVQGG